MSELFAIFFFRRSIEAAGHRRWPLEMQSQRHDAHRAIVSSGLVCSSLCSTIRAKTQINSIWWLKGDSYTATQCLQPTYKHIQHKSRHMWHSTVVDFFFFFFPRCNVTAPSCVTPVMYCHIILLIVLKTFGECATSSARLVWNHDMQSVVQNMCKPRRCQCARWNFNVCVCV